MGERRRDDRGDAADDDFDELEEVEPRRPRRRDDDFDEPPRRRRQYDDDYDDRPIRASESATNGPAVAGLVLGISGFVIAFIPCVGWLSILIGIVGVVFSAIGISQAKKPDQGKGMAITGLIMSILAVIWWPIWIFLFWAILFGAAAASR
jgi:hypothetical protein